ncbi:hypothetical protein DVR12_22170 [Chitinophaga silvatica]|uniref:Uncharacterized protein n=1 Tax=Chitinophaga silvatica TaxID=2282649 RepID=A0A3E1Y537_9BACT|nr:hypothetical protein DVR12_22170 [Chitinophaga silvatica]
MYRIEGIYYDDILTDSFVYKGDLLTEAWFYGENGYTEMSQYTYNDAGFIIKSVNFERFNNTMKLYSSDSLVWSASTITQYSKFSDANTILMDTPVISIDANKRIGLIRTKDTIRYPQFRQLYYTEYTFTGNNMTTNVSKYYRDYYIENHPSSFYDQVITFEYGNLINPLRMTLINNPLLSFREEKSLISVNNPTKLIQSFADKFNEHLANYNITSEALPNTQIMYKSTYKEINSDASWVMKFKIKTIIK